MARVFRSLAALWLALVLVLGGVRWSACGCSPLGHARTCSASAAPRQPSCACSRRPATGPAVSGQPCDCPRGVSALPPVEEPTPAGASWATADAWAPAFVLLSAPSDGTAAGREGAQVPRSPPRRLHLLQLRLRC